MLWDIKQIPQEQRNDSFWLRRSSLLSKAGTFKQVFDEWMRLQGRGVKENLGWSEKRHQGVHVRGALGSWLRRSPSLCMLLFSCGLWHHQGYSSSSRLPLHPSRKCLWRNSDIIAEFQNQNRIGDLVFWLRWSSHLGMSRERWFPEEEVCPAIRKEGT